MEQNNFPFRPIPPDRQPVPPFYTGRQTTSGGGFYGAPFPQKNGFSGYGRGQQVPQKPQGSHRTENTSSPGMSSPPQNPTNSQGLGIHREETTETMKQDGKACTDACVQNGTTNARGSGREQIPQGENAAFGNGSLCREAGQCPENVPLAQKKQKDNASSSGCGTICRQYAAKEEYPPAQAKEKNVRYAQLLRMDFSSPQSEMTASMQYIYQSWMVKQKNPELSEVFFHIALVEMHHLDLLGQMILSLGATPSYTYWMNGRNFVWTGGMVRYENDPKTMLKTDIAGERNAIAGYERRIAAIQDTCVKKLLERIILDEKIHLQILEEFLQKC